MKTQLVNPLEKECEAFEAISKAIEALKDMARMYQDDEKVCKRYVDDIVALSEVRLNYAIAYAIDLND